MIVDKGRQFVKMRFYVKNEDSRPVVRPLGLVHVSCCIVRGFGNLGTVFLEAGVNAADGLEQLRCLGNEHHRGGNAGQCAPHEKAPASPTAGNTWSLMRAGMTRSRSFDDRDFNRERDGARLFADEFGRLLPATNRFPSAADGKGFKPLADQIHAHGIEIRRPHDARHSAAVGLCETPIEGCTFTAADAGNTNSICGWCPDMFGVRNNAAGQAWYDSMLRLYAAWGLDFMKVDDLSVPYSADEIEMIRKAIDKCGRPIVFSTSPGPTDACRTPTHISTPTRTCGASPATSGIAGKI